MPPLQVRVRGLLAGAVLAVCTCLLSGAALDAQQRPPARPSGGRANIVATADSSLPLFVVMAAVNAAGYDTDLDSAQNSPIRKQVRADIGAAAPACLPALHAFYTVHRSPAAARDLSQWISFALLLNGPPDFQFRVRELELPAEVAALRDLRPLLTEFYNQAHLDQLWEKYRPAYEAELSRYNEGLGQVMLEVNGYLRLGSSSFLGRDFSIYVDLLGAPNQANARSFGRDYYVVLSAAPRPQIDEVRHGYLHYVLEPMSDKQAAAIREKADLRLFAEGAPALDPILKNNFRLLLSESLIRAAELRMARMPPGAKQVKLAEILADGHILAPYFFEALEAFEKQDAGMRIYYPDMIEKLDVHKEQKRLAKVTFRAAPLAAGAPHELPLVSEGAAPGDAAAGSAKPGSEEAKLLAQGEDAMARHEIGEAQKFFQAAADLKGPLEGHAIYGLALVASQQQQPEVAKTFFKQAIDISRDPHVVAWANIYMGRISDMEENRELALKYYQQALKAGDNAAATVQAAERGLREPFRYERKPPADETKKDQPTKP